MQILATRCALVVVHLILKRAVDGKTVWRIAMISSSAYHFHPHNVRDMMMNCCMYRVSACSALPLFRCTVCTGRLMPAFRRPRPSSPPESCPIRPYARRLPTPPPTLPPTPPRGPSLHLGRERREGLGGWEVEEGGGGLQLVRVSVWCLFPHR